MLMVSGLLIGFFISALIGLYYESLSLALILFLTYSHGLLLFKNWLFWKKANQWASNTNSDYPYSSNQTLKFFSKIHRNIRALQQNLNLEQKKNNNFTKMLDYFSEGLLLLNKENKLIWVNKAGENLLDLRQEDDYLQDISNLLRQPVIGKYLSEKSFKQSLKIPNFKANTGITIYAYEYNNDHTLLWIQDISESLLLEKMQRDFISNVSHELRTPLTVFNSSIEALKHPNLTDEQSLEVMNIMDQQLKRMLSLVDDLLNLSTLESKPLPNFNEKINVASLALETQTSSNLLSKDHQFIIQYRNIDEKDIASFSILGEEKEIKGALLNLINNAILHAQNCTTLTLEIERLPNNALTLHLKNDGQGIAADKLHKLTERFYRSSKNQGTGLGLAIVKTCMQRHGGELKITSDENKGSCFSLLFPNKRIKQS